MAELARRGRDGRQQWLADQRFGAPPFPYYVADDDFRKVAAGQSIVQLTQGTTSSVRLFTIYTMEGAPTNGFICPFNPYGEKMIAAAAQAKNVDRFETAIDTWTKEAAYQREPLFLSISLQNFVERADWNRCNCLAVEHLREEARTQKIVFTQGEAIADYFHNHYAHQPENWIYWPDVYAGLAEDRKPDLLADHMELSNVEFHSDSWDGEALPRFFWDYTQPWSNPAWDDAKGLRDPKCGLIPPEQITADNDTVPHMVKLDGVKTRVDMKPDGIGVVTVKVVIDSPKAFAFLPIAVWRIPLAGKGLTSQGPGNGRFIPIVDGATENLHGLAVCRDVKAGHGEWTYELKGTPRPFMDPEIHIGHSVLGRIFVRDGVPHAYVWLINGERDGMLSIKVPPGRHVRVHYNDGTGEEVTGGAIQVRIGQDWSIKSPMITGLEAREVETCAMWMGKSEPMQPGAAVEAPARSLATPEPALAKSPGVHIAGGAFKPTWESLTKGYRCPEWFRDAKFGIWAHWTAQCVPEKGDWFARSMYEAGSEDYNYSLQTHGPQSKFGFKDYDHLWKAEHWDPDKLMALYKRAGAHYFMALANHHDNFDCYDSKYQPWNSTKVGPMKDIVGIWAEVARKNGLHFGVSNHSSHAWHWFQVAYGYDTEGPYKNASYDGWLTKADGKGQWWEGLDPQDLYCGTALRPSERSRYRSLQELVQNARWLA